MKNDADRREWEIDSFDERDNQDFLSCNPAFTMGFSIALRGERPTRNQGQAHERTNARRNEGRALPHRLLGKSIESVMANTKTAVLGGGCFWCVEAALLQLEGVLSVESGYMGGQVDQPTYQQVCAGGTGHTEVVRVEFDPSVISFGELLEVFFTAHDPTTLNRQGNDIGTQYRSAIFVLDEAQRAEAERVIADLEKKHVFDAPIVTSVEPARTFWKAEAYHQNYFANNSHQPYCLFAVAPKVVKVRAKYADRVKRAG